MAVTLVFKRATFKKIALVLTVLLAGSSYLTLHDVLLTSLQQYQKQNDDRIIHVDLPPLVPNVASTALPGSSGEARSVASAVLMQPSPQPRPRPQRKWAYAYLMAGVDTQHRGYRGFLYNVLVAAEIMKDSSADVVLMVQMSSPFEARLTPREEGWLHAMNVTIKYLDWPAHGIQNFYTVQLEKFHILEFTEYSRVIFMDGDVLPLCPLDYMFEMSEPLQDQTDEGSAATNGTIEKPPLFQPNVVIAFKIEPAHGGFFMLAPMEGDFELLEGEVRRREDEVLTTGKVFDKRTGWGHVIEPPDQWRSESGWEGPNATFWKWHGDFVDQGLLYYWTKYFKKSVSIIINNVVENWSATKAIDGLEGKVYLDKTWQLPCTKYRCVPQEYLRPSKYNYGSGYEQFLTRDFEHFTGVSKPWSTQEQARINVDAILGRFKARGLQGIKSPQEFWYLIFHKVHDLLQMNNVTADDDDVVDIRDLTIPRAKLGGYPTFKMMNTVIQARTGKSVDHIEGWADWEKEKKGKRKLHN